MREWGCFRREWPFRSGLALSVTFGATSPIGRGTGVPVRPTPDEQSPIFRKQECPAVKANSSLTKCACPEPSTRPVPQRAREPDAFCRIPLYSDAFMLPLTYRVPASFYGHFVHFPCFLALQKCTFPYFWSFPAFFQQARNPSNAFYLSSFIIARCPSLS